MARIAVVDDMAVNRKLLSTLLHAMGHRVDEASNGAEALDLVRREQPHVVICDILMPVMDGYEFVRRLRADPDIGHIPVVFITAYYLELEAQHLALACGVSEILTKPFEPEQIVKVLDRLLIPSTVPQAPRDKPPLPLDEFDRDHLRLMTDKLSDKVIELQASNKKLASLIDLNLQLASRRDAADLVETVCDGARQLLGASYGTAAIVGAASRAIQHAAHSGLSDEALVALGDFQLQSGALASVLNERITCRVSQSEYPMSQVGLPVSYPEIQAVVAAPIVSLSTVYGFVCLSNWGNNGFTEDDEHLLEVIAAQAGRIYENTVLYAQVEAHAAELETEIVDRKRAQRQLAAQYAVARLLARSDTFEDAIPPLLEAVCDDLGFAAGCLWKVDDANHVLRVVDASCRPATRCGHFVDEIRSVVLTADAPLAGEAWRTGKPVSAQQDAIEQFCSTLAADAGLRSGVALPVAVRGHTVGVLEFFSRRPEELETGVLDTVAAIADQLGQFFERNRQHQRIVRLTRVHAVLSGINAAIVRIRDRHALLREACEVAVDKGQFGMAWIGEIDPVADRVVPVAWAGVSDDIARPSMDVGADCPQTCPIGAAVRQAKPIVINDLHAVPAVGERMAHALERGFRSQVVLPLLVDGKPVGVVVLYASEADFFNEGELSLLSELADDVAFALDFIDKQNTLAYLAYFDALTGLGNRVQLLERLSAALTRARDAGRRLAVVGGNVDRFRNINDTLGRQVGDQLLKELAERLRDFWPDESDLSRIPADQFLGILPPEHEFEKTLHSVKAQVEEMTRQSLHIGQHEIRISFPLGVAVFPQDGADPDTLIKNAEAALRHAKATGNSCVLYRPEMNADAARSLLLENKLRLAMERGEFVLYYQPKVCGKTRELTGLEALIRWRDPDGGVVPPGVFIPLLEETGLVRQVGSWVIHQAVRDAQRWRRMGLNPPRIAVNVSAIQLQQADFVESVRLALIDGNGAPEIDLEITESMLMSDTEQNIGRLDALRQLGIEIAIDDFGTGYSSLGYLARLPVNALKIDQSFVQAMTRAPRSRALATAIISMAHSLDLKVVAEGVEAEAQAEFLSVLNCNELQGFLISQPLPSEQMVEFLRTYRPGRWDGRH